MTSIRIVTCVFDAWYAIMIVTNKFERNDMAFTIRDTSNNHFNWIGTNWPGYHGIILIGQAFVWDCELLTPFRIIRITPNFNNLQRLVVVSSAFEYDANHVFLAGAHNSFVCGVTTMTSSNGNIVRVTGHLCGEFTGQIISFAITTFTLKQYFTIG